MTGFAQNTPLSSKKHYYAVDALRGICAILVIFFHYVHFYYNDGEYHLRGLAFEQAVANMPFTNLLGLFYRYGGAAVQIFWCISGFVFASVYAGKTVSGREFFTKRFARLYPLHFLTLIIVALIQFTAVRTKGLDIVYENNDIYHFILNIFLASAWGLEHGYSFNSPIWSVSIEVLIYALFWMVSPKIFSWSYLKPIGIAILMIIILSLGAPLRFFWICGFYFFLGVSAYYLYVRARHPVHLSLTIAIIAFALAGLVYVYIVPELVMILPLLTVAAISGAVALDGSRWSPLFTHIRFAGDSTYGTYLWHVPIQLILILILDALGLRAQVVQSPLFLIFFLALVGSTGWLSYRFIEMPANRAILRHSGFLHETQAKSGPKR